MPNTKPASVFPIPVANWPNAPAVQVCESVPNKTYNRETHHLEQNQTKPDLIRIKPIISSERDCYLSWPAMTFLCKCDMANTFIIRISLHMREKSTKLHPNASKTKSI